MVQEYVAAGLLDELYLYVVLVVLGASDGCRKISVIPMLELVEVVGSRTVIGIDYHVVQDKMGACASAVG